MDNQEKLATWGTQDSRRRQAKQKHNTICVGHHNTQTNTNIVTIMHETSYKQQVKMNRTSFLWGNRNGLFYAVIYMILFFK